MGIFVSCLVAVIAIYFVQLGLRRGVFPVMLSLIVASLAFLVAVDFQGQAARLLSNWGLSWKEANLLAGGYLALFGVFFCLFGFFAVKYTPEIAPLQKGFDRFAGAIIGVLAGIVITGGLAYGWFTSSWAERYPIPDKELYLKPHNLLVRAYGRVAGRMSGGRTYEADKIIEVMQGKGLAMPRSGDGFWVSSVPQGLRVFVSTIRGLPIGEFERQIVGWVESAWIQGPVKGGSVIYGYIGKTPCRIDSDARSAWIAVETILPPDAPTGDPLVGDGESERYYYSGDGKRHFMKIYWLRKIEDETVAKQFALMYLKTATEKELEEAIPKEEMFRIKQPENALAALTNDGLSDMAANRIMRLALRAGKVLYKATNGQDKAFEITSADGEFDVKTVEQR